LALIMSAGFAFLAWDQWSRKEPSEAAADAFMNEDCTSEQLADKRFLAERKAEVISGLRAAYAIDFAQRDRKEPSK